MRARRSERGLTVVEFVVGAALAIGILSATNMMVAASSGVARSTNDEGVAGNRAERVLQSVAQSLRRGSLASVEHLDGTTFADGETDNGLVLREVTDYEGGFVLSNPVTYRLDIPVGSTHGDLIVAEDGVDAVLASGVVAFTVTRAGNLFNLEIRARSGPEDDRGRNVRATLGVSARNP